MKNNVNNDMRISKFDIVTEPKTVGSKKRLAAAYTTIINYVVNELIDLAL